MARLRRIYADIARAAAVGGLLALSACLGGCDWLGNDNDPPELAVFSATVPADFVPHCSRLGNVEIRTPKTWHEVSTTGAVMLYLRTAHPSSSVSLVITTKSDGESLATTMLHLPDDLKHEFADFELIKSDLVVINDIPAGRIVYEGSRGGFHGRLMAVLIDKGGKSYVLTYTAAPEDFDDELDAFESVLASAKIP